MPRCASPGLHTANPNRVEQESKPPSPLPLTSPLLCNQAVLRLLLEGVWCSAFKSSPSGVSVQGIREKGVDVNILFAQLNKFLVVINTGYIAVRIAASSSTVDFKPISRAWMSLVLRRQPFLTLEYLPCEIMRRWACGLAYARLRTDTLLKGGFDTEAHYARSVERTLAHTCVLDRVAEGSSHITARPLLALSPCVGIEDVCKHDLTRSLAHWLTEG